MIDLRNVKQTAQVDAQTHERRGHELSICRDVVNHLYFGRHPFGGPTPFVFEEQNLRHRHKLLGSSGKEEEQSAEEDATRYREVVGGRATRRMDFMGELRKPGTGGRTGGGHKKTRRPLQDTTR
ncbi:uncharacterized protein LOC122574453 isoform X2 [Bombus pyrosoma]|uniref:uncharacterized protein LOC122574453 isoform X2 n=1 Tax=Bombus pyrosoma TaxID=396416 RepID=UPI001CB8FBCD|nr:uncharacterized protein LOC122574453 isoform X2 [Bombus pyrosoma]